MTKLLVPAALALALTVSGGAFAASMGNGIDLSLYEETSPFAAVTAPAHAGTDYRQSADLTAQRASTAPMTGGHGWDRSAETAANDLNGPE